MSSAKIQAMTANVSQAQAISEARAWYWQRVSAMVLAIFVVVHLAIMVYAMKGGLTAAEILSRTQGNWIFGAFYAAFVIACAVHVPIGVAKIAKEWGSMSSKSAQLLSRFLVAVILVMGFAAVWGVV